jgi:hypothetical protein
MHKTYEKTDARAEQTPNKTDCNSGWNSDVGCQSGSTGNQQKRISRADGPRQNFVGDGSSVTGGILHQLIDEYKSQLVAENELKKQVEAKIVQIESRIEEFVLLLEQLEVEKET